MTSYPQWSNRVKHFEQAAHSVQLQRPHRAELIIVSLNC